MKLLLDSDVLLDVAMAREPFGPESKTVLDWCHSSAGSAAVAWHTIANVYYLLRPTTGDQAARTFISGLLDFTDIAPTARDAVRRALSLKVTDFEDALQVAAAIAANVQFIITRNTADYRSSPVAAITPHDFLRRFVAK